MLKKLNINKSRDNDTKAKLIEEYKYHFDKAFSLYRAIIQLDNGITHPLCTSADVIVGHKHDDSEHIETDFIICSSLLKDDWDKLFNYFVELNEKVINASEQ